MYVKNELGFIPLPQFGIGLPKVKAPEATKAKPKTQGGFFNFLNRGLTTAQDAATKAIETKLAVEQFKSAWRGVPYALPQQPTGAGATGERFVPQTTQISRGNKITATKADRLSKSEILTVQRKLKAKGFNPGPLDGLYGPKTAAAIRNFQQANNLPVTGVLTYDLLSRLTAPAPASPNPAAYPSRPVQTSVPQSPTKVGSGAVPYYPTQPQIVQVPVQSKDGLPQWAIPAMAAGGGLLLLVMMQQR